MKRRHLQVVLPMLTAILLFSGCGKQDINQNDILDMLNTADNVTIDLNIEGDSVQGYEYTVNWIQLGDMTSSEDVRSRVDDLFNITGNVGNKNGVLYINEKGESTQNATLALAMRNTAVTSMISDDNVETLNNEIIPLYSDMDVDEERAIYCAISDYYELLKAGQGESLISDQISRAEAMSMVFRAMNPVDDSIMQNTQFNSIVGENKLNTFAAKEDSNCFINTSDGSLNQTTYTQSMTKAEFVYLVMNAVFGSDAVQAVDSTIGLDDLGNAGDLVTQNNINGTAQAHSAVLKSFINNLVDIDESLYKAIVLADNKGIINQVDDMENAINKGSAVEILCKALMQNPNIEEFSYNIEEVQEENTETIEGNAGGLSDNSGSEELLNSVSIEEEENIPEEVVETEKVEIEKAAKPQKAKKPAKPAFVVEDISEKTMYATSDCNIRKGPSTNYDKAGSLSRAQKVTVNGKVTYQDKTWFRLKTTDGSEQFVASSLLSDTKPTTTQKSNSNTNSSNTQKNTNNNSTKPSNNTNKDTQKPSSSGGGSALDQDPFASPDDSIYGPESGDTNDGQGGNWVAE